tara:strand:+ start:202 stop:363 length:162 start_codon:yes stop_codon:yes gene_type:complete
VEKSIKEITEKLYITSEEYLKLYKSKIVNTADYSWDRIAGLYVNVKMNNERRK